jgi:hypothetical protein
MSAPLTPEIVFNVLHSIGGAFDQNKWLGKLGLQRVSGNCVRLAAPDPWTRQEVGRRYDNPLSRAFGALGFRVKLVNDKSSVPQPSKRPYLEERAADDARAAQDLTPRGLRVRELPMFYAGNMREPVDLDEFVEGLLLAKSLNLIYGAPKTGKTFFVVDLGLHVATGREWRDRAVDQGGVLYLALEGNVGIRNRVNAWLQRHGAWGEDVPFAIVPVSLDLLHGDGDVEAVIASARRTAADFGVPIRLIVIDTLSRALAGGDENGPDMGLLVRAADQIREATGAAIILIHHPRKDGNGGERGHGSLRGALDMRIEVKRDEGSEIATARVIEARDIESGAAFPFRLEVVDLGENKRGKPITSCVAVPSDAAELKPRAPKVTGAAEIARTALANLLATEGQPVRRDGIPSNHPTVSVEAWREEANRCGISTGGDEAQRKAFQRATEKLCGMKLACIRDGLAWMP